MRHVIARPTDIGKSLALGRSAAPLAPTLWRTKQSRAGFLLRVGPSCCSFVSRTNFALSASRPVYPAFRRFFCEDR